MSEVVEEVIIKDEEVTREVIEQNINNEVPFEPVEMKKPRAKAKAGTVAITKDIMEAVKEATKKPAPDKPDKHKEMVTCPDCGLSITFHNLKYTHKRYCQDLKEKQEEIVPPPTPPPPGLLLREKDND
eukprot:7356028-Heterocapsa_arctica.AAC.1